MTEEAHSHGTDSAGPAPDAELPASQLVSRRRYQDMLDPVTVMARTVPAGLPMASSRCRVTAGGRSITG